MKTEKADREERVEHTPTPWEVSESFLHDKNKLIITQSGDSANIAHIQWAHGNQSLSPADHANAHFIVAACNSHEALVSALRGLVELVDSGVEDGNEQVNRIKADLRRVAPESIAYVKAARAALQAAGVSPKEKAIK